LLGVISRKTGTYKILDISYAVFSQIRKYARNTARWGDPTKYDVDIVVDKNGGPTGYYSVQAVSKEPLSAADNAIKDGVDLDELKRRVTPPTPEQVLKRLEYITGAGAGAGASAGASDTSSNKEASRGTNAPASVNMSDDEDELDGSFPDYKG
jgi:hypothetical protein